MSFPKIPKLGASAWILPVRDQSGQAVLAWVLVMMTLFGGILSALTGYSMTTLMATQKSRDFVIAGQLGSEAIQDALYQLNEGTQLNTPATVDGYFDSTKLPLTANVDSQCGISIDKAILTKSSTWKALTQDPATKVYSGVVGCGNYDSGSLVGKWQWSVNVQPSTTSHPKYVITATGAFGKAKRSVTADFYGMDVTSAVTDKVGGVSYVIPPSGAFTHTLFGTESSSWVAGANQNSFLQGRVASNNTITINKSTSPTAQKVDGVHFYNYAAAPWDVRCLSASKLDCQPIVRVPQTLSLNPAFVSTYSSGCSSAPQAWVASKNSGQLNAGVGNSGCFSSMVFDTDTTVTGAGFYSAFVGGAVTINPGVSIKTVGSANLVIYTTGSVNLNTASTVATTLNLFVYAPNGGCTFANSSGTAQPSFIGSLACRTVDLKGVTAQWETPPDGVDNPGSTVAVTPVRKVWYLDNMVEASGQSLK